MVALPEVSRNAEGAQSEGRASWVRTKKLGQGHYKGRSPVELRPVADLQRIRECACPSAVWTARRRVASMIATYLLLFRVQLSSRMEQYSSRRRSDVRRGSPSTCGRHP